MYSAKMQSCTTRAASRATAAAPSLRRCEARASECWPGGDCSSVGRDDYSMLGIGCSTATAADSVLSLVD